MPDLSSSVFSNHLANFHIKQIIAGHCARLILLVDYSKFGQRSLCKVLDVSQIHTIVTDSQAPQEAIDLLQQKGHEVQVVDLKGWREWGNGNAA